MDERDDAAVVTWLRLARVYHQIQQAATAQLREHGLTLAQFDVLAQIGADEGLTQQELADRLLVTKGNISQLVDRMAQAGLVERLPEGRVCRLALTCRGHALRDEVLPVHELLITRQLSGLCREDRETLRRLLRDLDRTLGRAGQQPAVPGR